MVIISFSLSIMSGHVKLDHVKKIYGISSDKLENKQFTTERSKNKIENMCEKVRKMNFTVQNSHMSISTEVDLLYKQGYLKILKNQIPTTSYNYKGEKEYFRDLYGIGTEFENLDEQYTFYYGDLDGDKLPEIAIKHGYTYILKYYPENDEFDVLYREATMYVKIIGVGQVWYHDGLHSGVIRDRLIVFNQENEWETVLNLEQGLDGIPYYNVGTNESNAIDVGKKNWDEITTPFFNMTQNEIPFQIFEQALGSPEQTIYSYKQTEDIYFEMNEMGQIIIYNREPDQKTTQYYTIQENTLTPVFKTGYSRPVGYNKNGLFYLEESLGSEADMNRFGETETFSGLFYDYEEGNCVEYFYIY